MKQIKSLLILSLFAFVLGLTSCSDDSSTPQKEVSVKELLNGDLVLNTRAFMGANDLTKLETGAPIMYNFTWNGDVLRLQFQGLKFGKMPFSLSYAVDLREVELTDTDKKEANLKGKSWIKLEGNNGKTTMGDEKPSVEDPQKEGGKVVCFVNTTTREVEMKVDFNLMKVRAEVIRQKIDPSRTPKYKEELDKYIKSLEEAKNKH